jgi:hypothetical protein
MKILVFMLNTLLGRSFRELLSFGNSRKVRHFFKFLAKKIQGYYGDDGKFKGSVETWISVNCDTSTEIAKADVNGQLGLFLKSLKKSILK